MILRQMIQEIADIYSNDERSASCVWSDINIVPVLIQLFDAEFLE